MAYRYRGLSFTNLPERSLIPKTAIRLYTDPIPAPLLKLPFRHSMGKLFGLNKPRLFGYGFEG